MEKIEIGNLKERDELLIEIEELCNQIWQFRFSSLDFGKLKILIKNTKLYSLENHFKHREFKVNLKELDEKYPKLRKEYNKLIEELKKENLSPERLEEIFRESWELTHPK